MSEDNQPNLFEPAVEKRSVATPPPSDGSRRIATVAVDSSLFGIFDYLLPNDFAALAAPGTAVTVPFGRGNRTTSGFIIEIKETEDTGRPLKPIRNINEKNPPIPPNLMALGRWMADYYCRPLGTVLAAMTPAAVKRRAGVVKRTFVELTLRPDQLDETLDKARLGPKQEKILRILASRDGALKRRALLDEAHCGADTLRRLRHRGLIHFRREEVIADQALFVKTESELAPTPTPEQKSAIAAIGPYLDPPSFGVFLLQGVTGSGKTEVYLRAIEQVLQLGKRAVILVPEICLTTQIVQRFIARFDRVAVLHSGQSPASRHANWRAVQKGEARVVIGPRSAVFAPIPDLGLIVVDEEHDSSYKQSSPPRYHGRDVAVKRAQLEGCPVILGSATPSLESRLNCDRIAHYHHLTLSRRVRNLPAPRIELVDMVAERRQRKGIHLLSRLLEQRLFETLEAGRQAILLLNRRGYAGFIGCNSCGWVARCTHCEVNLVFHLGRFGQGKTLCHHCEREQLAPPKCPQCGSRLAKLGPGTQRVEEELARIVPKARIKRVDSDAMNADEYHRVLTAFAGGELDVLCGTQVLAKGLDFPRVQLVGVVSADTALTLPDFRAAERTFQLVAHVAGRAGRAEKGAHVVIQTLEADNPTIRLAASLDYERFIRTELRHRRDAGYPPFARLARIILRSQSSDELDLRAAALTEGIEETIAKLRLPIRILGPAPAALARVADYHRRHILLFAPTAGILMRLLARLRDEGRLLLPRIRLALDVDPVDLM